MDEYWVAVVPRRGTPFFQGPYTADEAQTAADTEKGAGGNAVVIGRR